MTGALQPWERSSILTRTTSTTSTRFQRRTNPAADPFGNAPRLNGATRMFPTYPNQRCDHQGASVYVRRLHADLRVEIFDLFNQKTWNRPVSQDLANAQFGVITGASGNRTMQFGLKFVF